MSSSEGGREKSLVNMRFFMTRSALASESFFNSAFFFFRAASAAARPKEAALAASMGRPCCPGRGPTSPPLLALLKSAEMEARRGNGWAAAAEAEVGVPPGELDLMPPVEGEGGGKALYPPFSSGAEEVNETSKLK